MDKRQRERQTYGQMDEKEGPIDGWKVRKGKGGRENFKKWVVVKYSMDVHSLNYPYTIHISYQATYTLFTGPLSPFLSHFLKINSRHV